MGSDRLLELAQRRGIGCSTEDLFHAVMRWVLHNVDGRGGPLSGLGAAVRLPVLSMPLLTEIFRWNCLLWSQCIGEVQSAVSLHFLSARAGELRSCRAS